MKRLFIATLLLGLSAVTATAYTRITTSSGHAPRWESMPISYSINERGAPDVINDSEFFAIRSAFQTWQNVASAGVRFDYQGTSPITEVGRDGVNLVTFADDTIPYGSSVLAATVLFYEVTENGPITAEADIVFSIHKDWQANGVFANAWYDIQAVMTHEVGHLLGLDHSGLLSSVMYPFTSIGNLHSRFLQYDDVAGVSEIYPGGTPAVGQISGIVTASGSPVFGGHVVAVDRHGTPLVATISGQDGRYTLRHLPPGRYRVYVEPLDYPVTEEEIGGFYTGLNKDFGTTYFSTSPTLAMAQEVEVRVGETASADIPTLPKPAGGLNMLRSRPLYLERDVETLIGFDGIDFSAGTLYTPSNDGLLMSGQYFGTSSFSPPYVNMRLRPLPSVALGPKNMAVNRGSDAAVASGAIIVQDKHPDISWATPMRGSPDGYQYVSITGRDFRPGATAYFAGIPALETRFITPNLLETITPPNPAGANGLLVINSDGTYGDDTYGYVASAPSITRVTPTSGAPGTVVVIEGNNFGSDLQNTFVSFNGTGTFMDSVTPTRIVTAVPYTSSTGNVTVGVSGEAARGPVFTVTNPGPATNLSTNAYTLINGSAATGGTALSFSNTDNGLAQITVPFGFTFFGRTYIPGKAAVVSTNGWISLSTTFPTESVFVNPVRLGESVTASAVSSCIQRPASTVETAADIIAPFFDDLAMVPGRSSISTRLIGNAPDRRFVVQWSRMTILDDEGCDLGSDITFKFVLYEHSNDIQFLYETMNGPRAGGSSATIGMKGGFSGSETTSFNRVRVASGSQITYRFWVSQVTTSYFRPAGGDATPPSVPYVRDGTVVANMQEVQAWWIAEDPESGLRGYEFKIGTSPGASDIADVLLTYGNGSSGSGTLMPSTPGSTYYFTVRAINNDGLASDWAYSDGVRVDPTVTNPAKVIPYVSWGPGRYTGVALVSTYSSRSTFRAISSSGVEIAVASSVGSSHSGQQYVALLSQVFPQLKSFEGWIEVTPTNPDLNILTVIGSYDGEYMDGAVPRASSSDFVALHPHAALVLVNSATTTAEVTVTPFDGTAPRTYSIPARQQLRIVTGAVSRVQSTVPLFSTEVIETTNRLSLATPESTAAAGSELLFVDALIMNDYSTTLTLANVGATAADLTVTFGGFIGRLQIPANSSRAVLLHELFGNPSGVHRYALRVRASSEVAAARLVGTVDLQSAINQVSYGSRAMATDFAFGQVAHGPGWFTGLCLVAGDSETTVTIEVYNDVGNTRRSATVVLAANQQAVRLLSQLVPDFTNAQMSGYIRVRSDKPMLAWTVYGTQSAFASSPPF